MINKLLSKLPKPLANFVWALPGVAERAPVLALVHDGFSLHGLLLQREGKRGIQVVSHGVSRAVHLHGAIAEVLAQTGGKPRQAILATVTASISLLDLPIDSEQAKPARDMLGLVRWELEPLMAEQINLWSLGAILQGRGYLSADSRQRVMDELALRQHEPSSKTSSRFGEIALSLGLVKRDQIEECLTLQSQLQHMDDQVLCAWSARGLLQEGGHSLWLAAGIGLSMQTRWVDAFARCGLTLRHIFPLTGACLPQCKQTAVVLEQLPNQIMLTRLCNGQPERVLCRPLEAAGLQHSLRNVLTEFLDTDDKEITLFSCGNEADKIAQFIQHEFARQVTQLPRESSPWQPALLGIAQQYWFGSHLPPLPASEPLPPARQRPQIWVLVSGLLFVCLVAIYEGSAWGRMWWMEAQLGELSNSKQEHELAKKRSESETQQAKTLQEQVKQLQTQQQSTQAELSFYRDELGGRVAFVSEAMTMLAETASNEVLVLSLEEKSWFTLSLSAWSLSQSAGYRFAKDMASALAKWKFEVRDVEVKSQPGRNGQHGYAVTFNLERTQEGKREDKK